MRTMIAMAMSLSFATAALAQPKPPAVPPTLKQVAHVDKDKGQFIVAETVTRYVPVTVERIVIVNGQQVRKQVTEYQTVVEQRMVVHEAAKQRFIGRDGKQVPMDEVWKRLKKDVVIVVSADANAPAEAYLRALSAETLVVIPPALPAPPLPGPPLPPPLPPARN